VTSLREALRRLLGRDPSEAARAAGFSYAIFWTRLAQSWPPERRQRIRLAVEAVTRQPDFSANLYLRNYRIAELDEQAHAGASLQALLRVLQALPDTEEAEP
jgi:hypothetical protein